VNEKEKVGKGSRREGGKEVGREGGRGPTSLVVYHHPLPRPGLQIDPVQDASHARPVRKRHPHAELAHQRFLLGWGFHLKRRGGKERRGEMRREGRFRSTRMVGLEKRT